MVHLDVAGKIVWYLKFSRPIFEGRPKFFKAHSWVSFQPWQAHVRQYSLVRMEYPGKIIGPKKFPGPYFLAGPKFFQAHPWATFQPWQAYASLYSEQPKNFRAHILWGTQKFSGHFSSETDIFPWHIRGAGKHISQKIGNVPSKIVA